MYKKISFVGLGKLGLPLATNFAKNGHEVLAVDKNTRLIEILNAGKEPWVEVGLLDNIKQAKNNITYTTGYDGVGKSDVSIILVNTPSIKKVKGSQEAHECIRPTDLKNIILSEDKFSKDNCNIFFLAGGVLLILSAFVHTFTDNLTISANKNAMIIGPVNFTGNLTINGNLSIV